MYVVSDVMRAGEPQRQVALERASHRSGIEQLVSEGFPCQVYVAVTGLDGLYDERNNTGLCVPEGLPDGT